MTEFDLVVIGHVSFDENIIEGQKHIMNSGAAYLTALPASLFSKRVGIVSRVGEDYPLGILQKLGVNLDGIKVIAGGKTTRFYHTYLSEDCSERTFRAEMNVGVDLAPNDIPPKYFDSKYIHIATNLPANPPADVMELGNFPSKSLM